MGAIPARLREISGESPPADSLRSKINIKDNWRRLIGEAKSLPRGYALKFDGYVRNLAAVALAAGKCGIRVYVSGRNVYLSSQRKKRR